MPRQRSGRALRLRRPLEPELALERHVERHELAGGQVATVTYQPEVLDGLRELGRQVLVDELGAGASITPRPSCCVVCGRELVGYSTCGMAACVVEVLRRSRGGRG